MSAGHEHAWALSTAPLGGFLLCYAPCRHELPALLARLDAPLPRALWFAAAVMGPLAARVEAAAQRQAGRGSGGQRPQAGHAAQPRREPGAAQVWTRALLALLSALATALAEADAAGTVEGDAGTPAAAAPVATPEQPALSPATEQQAFRGAASDGGGRESAAAAMAAGGQAPDSAEAAAALLVESACGDAGRLRAWWTYALRLACYSSQAGCGAPADALDWALARLEARQAGQPLAVIAAPGVTLAEPAAALEACLLQDAALQLVGACIEDVAASWRGAGRLIAACMPLAAGTGGASARLSRSALDVLRALVLLVPGVLPSLKQLPQLAALLGDGGPSSGDSRRTEGGAVPGPDSLTTLAARAVDVAMQEARALAAAVNPPLLTFSGAAAFAALDSAASLGDARRGLETLLTAAGERGCGGSWCSV